MNVNPRVILELYGRNCAERLCYAEPALVSFFESRKMRLNPNRQMRKILRAEFQYNSARQLRKLRNYLRNLNTIMIHDEAGE